MNTTSRLLFWAVSVTVSAAIAMTIFSDLGAHVSDAINQLAAAVRGS
jgi:hypothetical protein